MKMCTSCKTEKPESEFHRFGKDGARIGKWCKDCYTKNKKKTPRRSAQLGSSV
jgi:hypothetical protein